MAANNPPSPAPKASDSGCHALSQCMLLHRCVHGGIVVAGSCGNSSCCVTRGSGGDARASRHSHTQLGIGRAAKLSSLDTLDADE